MRHGLKWFSYTLLCVSLFLCGCSTKPYVRHLASDASLIIPQQTTKKQILAFMGQPDQKRVFTANSEEWTYFQVNKSMLRKAPYVGDKMGSESFDVVMIVFDGDIAQNNTYRLLNEKEFLDSGIKSDQKIDEE